MRFQKIEKIGLKEKSGFIETICLEYKKALIDQNMNADFRKEENQKLINIINNILNMMDEDEKNIIKNDFLFRKSSNWWMQYYSKSNYYLKRKKAINYFSYFLFS